MTKMAFRIRFDASRCDGFGMCSLLCPDRISLDRWGFAHIDPEPIVDRNLRKQADRAVRCCPRHALSLESVDDAGRAVTNSVTM